MNEIDTDKYPEMRMKHLEFIQSIISRMAQNSSSVKNYCLTVSAALIGFSATVNKYEVLLLTCPLFIIFWVLDAEYLSLEKVYRDKYIEVSERDYSQLPNFSLDYPKDKKVNFFFVMFNWSVFPVYSLVIALHIAVFKVL